MTTAEELRLGNLLMTIKNDHIITVGPDEIIYLLQEARTHKLMGIPLTDEWLEKLGFTTRGKGWYKREGFLTTRLVGNRLEVYTIHDAHHIIARLQFIHQLQNLYFALTGEELKEKDNFIEI